MQNSEIDEESLSIIKKHLEEEGLKVTKKQAIISAVDIAAQVLKQYDKYKSKTERKIANFKRVEDIINLNGKLAFHFGIIGFILFGFFVYLFFTS